MGHYRVSGKTQGGRDRFVFVEAHSVMEAERIALELPMAEGGFTSWSTEKFEELPEEALMVCANCGHKNENPKVVISAVKVQSVS